MDNKKMQHWALRLSAELGGSAGKNAQWQIPRGKTDGPGSSIMLSSSCLQGSEGRGYGTFLIYCILEHPFQYADFTIV